MKMIEFFKKYFEVTGIWYYDKHELKKSITQRFRIEVMFFSPLITIIFIILTLTIYPKYAVLIPIPVASDLIFSRAYQVNFLSYFVNYQLSKKCDSYCKQLLLQYTFSLNQHEHITNVEMNKKFSMKRLSHRNLISMKYKVFEKKKYGNILIRIYRSKIVVRGWGKTTLYDKNYSSFDDFINELSRVIYNEFYR